MRLKKTQDTKVATTQGASTDADHNLLNVEEKVGEGQGEKGKQLQVTKQLKQMSLFGITLMAKSYNHQLIGWYLYDWVLLFADTN